MNFLFEHVRGRRVDANEFLWFIIVERWAHESRRAINLSYAVINDPWLDRNVCLTISANHLDENLASVQHITLIRVSVCPLARFSIVCRTSGSNSCSMNHFDFELDTGHSSSLPLSMTMMFIRSREDAFTGEDDRAMSSTPRSSNDGRRGALRWMSIKLVKLIASMAHVEWRVIVRSPLPVWHASNKGTAVTVDLPYEWMNVAYQCRLADVYDRCTMCDYQRCTGAEKEKARSFDSHRSLGSTGSSIIALLCSFRHDLHKREKTTGKGTSFVLPSVPQ